jgi:hypothetical protein
MEKIVQFLICESLFGIINFTLVRMAKNQLVSTSDQFLKETSKNKNKSTFWSGD